MSKPNSKPPTNQRPPPTEEELEKMALMPCKKGDDCDHHKRGKCRYSHSRVVTHNSISHKQNPPSQQEPQQEPPIAEIFQRIVKLPNCGVLANKVLSDPSSSAESLKDLHSAKNDLKEILAVGEIDKSNLHTVLEEVSRKFAKCSKFLKVFNKNILIIMRDDSTQEDIRSILSGLIECLELPSEVDSLFDQLTKSTESVHSFASAVKTDPLQKAMKKPADPPSKELLEYLNSACDLSENPMFQHMREVCERLGAQSPFKNENFLQIHKLHQASKLATPLLENLRMSEIFEQQLSSAKAELLRNCATPTFGSNMTLAFYILKSIPEFSRFVEALSSEERKVLITVFGSFMTYLSHAHEKRGLSTEMTEEFLTTTFKSFSRSRQVDGASIDFKDKFFKEAKTDMFYELIKVLHTQTDSFHLAKDGSRIYMSVQEILKSCLKEILSIYSGQVPEENLDEFHQNLVKHLLPFMFLISLSPQNANMLSARWKRGYIKDGKLTGEHAFKQMELSDAKKSVLYWLLQYVNIVKSRRSKKKVDVQLCDDFAKLSGEFRRKLTDDSKDDRTVFCPEMLFKALDEILVDSFLKSSDFKLSLKNITPTQLGTIFKIENDSVSISDSFQDTLLMSLYYSFGSGEEDPKTRPYSCVKAVYSVPVEHILKIVEVCQTFTKINGRETVNILLKMLNIEGTKHLQTAVLSFMTLLSENPTPDILQRAYDVMSLGKNLEDILGNTSYFLSLIDALIVVLLMDKYKKVKLLDILTALYDAKHPGFKFAYRRLETACETAESERKDVAKFQRMRELLGKGTTSDKTVLPEVTSVISLISEILCKTVLREDSFHEIFKRFLPFLLNKLSLIALVKSVPEFELVSSDGLSEEISVEMMVERIQSLFDSELAKFITGQNEAIQRDLRMRISEIKQTQSLAERIKTLNFTKHISAITNLLNNLFSCLGLSHTITYDQIMVGFPDTKDLSDPASCVTKHVMAVIGVQKPKKPSILTQIQELKKSEMHLDEADKSEIVLNLNQKKRLDQYMLSLENVKTMNHLILTAISAIYRVELPKTELSKKRKIDTIKLSELKTLLLTSKDLYELFNKCLPYWKSNLVRDIVLSIIQHAYQAGEKCVKDLFQQIQLFSIQFESNETADLSEMFVTLGESCDKALPKVDVKYTISNHDQFEQIMQSFDCEFWNDDVAIEVSHVKKTSAIIRASGGGAARVPEKLDPNMLAQLLSEDMKSDAIAYMQESVLNQDASEILEYLIEDEDSTCEAALEALSQFFELN